MRPLLMVRTRLMRELEASRFRLFRSSTAKERIEVQLCAVGQGVLASNGSAPHDHDPHGPAVQADRLEHFGHSDTRRRELEVAALSGVGPRPGRRGEQPRVCDDR